MDSRRSTRFTRPGLYPSGTRRVPVLAGRGLTQAYSSYSSEKGSARSQLGWLLFPKRVVVSVRIMSLPLDSPSQYSSYMALSCTIACLLRVWKCFSPHAGCAEGDTQGEDFHRSGVVPECLICFLKCILKKTSVSYSMRVKEMRTTTVSLLHLMLCVTYTPIAIFRCTLWRKLGDPV